MRREAENIVILINGLEFRAIMKEACKTALAAAPNRSPLEAAEKNPIYYIVYKKSGKTAFHAGPQAAGARRLLRYAVESHSISKVVFLGTGGGFSARGTTVQL
jgi:hypothetical protein